MHFQSRYERRRLSVENKTFLGLTGGWCQTFDLSGVTSLGSELNTVHMIVDFANAACLKLGSCEDKFSIFYHQKGEFYFNLANKFPGVSYSVGQLGRLLFIILEKRETRILSKEHLPCVEGGDLRTWHECLLKNGSLNAKLQQANCRIPFVESLR